MKILPDGEVEDKEEQEGDKDIDDNIKRQIGFNFGQVHCENKGKKKNSKLN